MGFRGLAVTLAAISVLVVPAAAGANIISAGPSLRVTLNVPLELTDGTHYFTQVEFKWTLGDLPNPWFGEVWVYADAAGTQPVAYKADEDGSGNPIEAMEHTIRLFAFPEVLAPDTTYYVRATSKDPFLFGPDLVSPLLPFFTGAQALRNVHVAPNTTSAVVSWQGNVIGLGRVAYGQTTSYGQTQDDAANVTDHSITVTGLQPATTYYFQVCNRHAIDGDCLAASTGSFMTQSTFTGQFLQPLDQSTDPANPMLNTGKNGKVVLVKVQITQGGAPITSLNAAGAVTLAVSKLATCSAIAGTDPIESYADAGQSSAGTNQLRYDTTAQAWLYGLDTKALGLVTGNCYRIDLSVNGAQVTNAFAVYKPTK